MLVDPRPEQERRSGALGVVYEVLRARAADDSGNAVDDAPIFLGAEVTGDVGAGCLYWAYWQLSESILEARVLRGDNPHPDVVHVIQWHGIRPATWPMLTEAIDWASAAPIDDGRPHAAVLEVLRSRLRISGVVDIERINAGDRRIQLASIHSHNGHPLDLAALEAAGFHIR